MSRFAHVPWCVGIQLAGVGLLWLAGFFAPAAFWIAGLAGFVTLVCREISQREYQLIELQPIKLRRYLKAWEAWRFWEWNAHSKAETVWSGIAVAAVAAAAQVAWRFL